MTKKLNEAEKRAKEAGFIIGKRSPKIGTKEWSTKKKAESYMKGKSK